MALIISLIISIVIINVLKQLLMTITGSSAMFYSLKGLIAAYIIVAVLLLRLFGSLF